MYKMHIRKFYGNERKLSITYPKTVKDEIALDPEDEAAFEIHRNDTPLSYNIAKGLLAAKLIDLRSLRKNYENKITYKCKICSKTFITRNYLKIHIRIHTGDRPYKCIHCLKTFTEVGHLNRHLEKHAGIKYKCDVCAKELVDKSSLKVHIRTHTGEKPYKCSLCSKSFRQTSGLNVHLEKHAGIKYNCEKCLTEFSSKYYLKKHQCKLVIRHDLSKI